MRYRKHRNIAFDELTVKNQEIIVKTAATFTLVNAIIQEIDKGKRISISVDDGNEPERLCSVHGIYFQGGPCPSCEATWITRKP
jgi:hypothetical protein